MFPVDSIFVSTDISGYDPIETYLQGAIVYSGGAIWELIAVGPITV